jgi:hypothetical protein
MTAKKPGPGAQQGQAKAPPAQVFRVGVYETDTPDIDVSVTQIASAVKLGTFKLSPNGWLSYVQFLFQMSGYTGVAATYTNDSPWSVIQKVTFRDVGNREIFGPLTGYEWFTVNKWGGYFGAEPDPRNPATGFATPSTGNFTFLLYIPLEMVMRDTLGEIENKSASSSYTVEIFMDSIANTFGVVPSGGTGVLRCRGNLMGYTEPEASDSHGRPLSQAPPAAGTVQYWAQELAVMPAGIGRYSQQNGIGYSIRNLVYLNYDNANGTRATGQTDWPDPATLSFGKVQLFQRPLLMWQALMARWFGLSAAGPDANLAPENGVFVQPFNRDFADTPGQELRNALLVTKAGNVLQIAGTMALAANIHILTNYIVPPGNDAARLRSR